MRWNIDRVASGPVNHIASNASATSRIKLDIARDQSLLKTFPPCCPLNGSNAELLARQLGMAGLLTGGRVSQVGEHEAVVAVALGNALPTLPDSRSAACYEMRSSFTM